MTKKSKNREMRDTIKENGSDWNDLIVLKNTIAEQFELFNVISGFIQNEQLMAFVQDRDRLNKDIRVLTADIQKFGTEMGSIYEQHKDRSGPIHTSPEFINDFWSFISIAEAYKKQATLIEAVVIPTFQNIMGQFSVAENLLKASIEAAADAVEKTGTAQESTVAQTV